jgi:primosomal protein N' (replication factor Y)
VVLHGELGPARRYRAYLAALRGQRRIVVGTRSAVFAPVPDLGAMLVWDDGDDLLAEPRAPYPHARDVALLRAHTEGAGLVLAGRARTAEAERLVQSGWARALVAPRETVRSLSPLVRTAGGDPVEGRLPRTAFRVLRAALDAGPVLVQVPRRGYWPALACRRCREGARCPACAGPLARADAGPAACRWCGRVAHPWQCPRCGGDGLRAMSVGSERTAEELGRAFPGVPVRQSGLGHVLDGVPDAPALVVATPGAEPPAVAGYAAALLLDGEVLLHRPDLRAAEEALRRWLGAAALVRPGPAGGTVVVVAPAAHRAVQALVRVDPAWFATRELADRESVRLPPAARLAEVTGAPDDVASLLETVQLPPSADVLGPVEEDGRARALVRCALGEGLALSRALQLAAGMRSLHRVGGPVRVRVDPVDVG